MKLPALATTCLLFACASTPPFADDAALEKEQPPAANEEKVVTAPPAQSSPAPEPKAAAAVPFEVWRRREPIYELYVRHFSPAGNFKGVEDKLPELKALGIGIVWLLPVNEIGSIAPSPHGGVTIDAPHGNPYAVKSYERVNPEYGTEDDLKRLVARAHDLNMRVILDWVPNHTAWDNPLLDQHPDWYQRTSDNRARPVSDEFNWIAQLDWSKPGLRDYMAGVMESWVKRFDVDGFRIDFAHSMPPAFFEALRPRLEKHKPVFLLAEAGRVDLHPTFDMTYDWDVYPLLGDVAQGWKSVSAIDDALLHNQFIPYQDKPNALVMRMTYNHDDNGKFTLAARYTKEGIKTFAVLASTLPGKPLVFDGQEVGMNVFDGTTVRPSINLGHDPKVKIDWNDPEGFRPFYTKLLRLFRANPALHQAGMSDFRKIDTTAPSKAYAFVRRDLGGPPQANAVLVVANLSAQSLPNLVLTPNVENVGSIAGDYTELFSGQKTSIGQQGASSHTLSLGPWEYRVYVRGPVDSND